MANRNIRKLIPRQQLTRAGCPGLCITVIDNEKCEIVNNEIQGYYIVQASCVYEDGEVKGPRIVGTSGSFQADIVMDAQEIHQCYVKSTAFEKKLVAQANDPDEPIDPNFDERGFPIYRPDWI